MSNTTFKIGDTVKFIDTFSNRTMFNHFNDMRFDITGETSTIEDTEFIVDEIISVSITGAIFVYLAIGGNRYPISVLPCRLRHV